MARKKFPALAVILLLFGVAWVLSDLNFFLTLRKSKKTAHSKNMMNVDEKYEKYLIIEKS